MLVGIEVIDAVLLMEIGTNVKADTEDVVAWTGIGWKTLASPDVLNFAELNCCGTITCLDTGIVLVFFSALLYTPVNGTGDVRFTTGILDSAGIDWMVI